MASTQPNGRASTDSAASKRAAVAATEAAEESGSWATVVPGRAGANASARVDGDNLVDKQRRHTHGERNDSITSPRAMETDGSSPAGWSQVNAKCSRAAVGVNGVDGATTSGRAKVLSAPNPVFVFVFALQYRGRSPAVDKYKR